MSLQLAAQHLSHQGRGGDSTLVHMSPREVKSLNDLAMAHGGQLSINPQTGLPEAGFLSSILPMVAGAALNAAVPGLGAGMSALMVGGGMALMTGSLEKGLMAGLGAYGGASLGGSLLASGAEPAAAGISEATAGQVATQTAEQAVAAQQAAEQAARAQALTSQNAISSTAAPIVSSAPVSRSLAPIETVTPTINPDHYSLMQNTSPAFQANVPPPMSFMDKIKTMGGNISPSNLMKFVKDDPMAAASGLASLYSPEKKKEEEKDNADMGQRYGFSMNPTGGQQTQPGQNPTTTPFPTPDIQGREQRYFSPSYTKLTPEQAKSMYGYAEGGTTQANPQPATEPFPIPRYTNEGKQPSNEAPALQAFRQMQAQRAVQPQTPQYASTPATGGAPAANAPVPTTVEGLYRTYLDRTPEQQGLEHWNKHFGSSVDADEAALFRRSAAPELAANKRQAEQTGGSLAHEYGEYLRQTVGEPNQLQAPAESPPATGDGFLRDFAGMKNNPFDYSNLSESERNRPGLFGPGSTGQNSDSEFIYNPIKQTYTKNPNFAEPSTEPAADAFNVENRPVVGYTASGEKIYGEKRMGGYGIGGGGHAAGGSISHLGDYSDGGRLLRGPGDGVSDSIPAMIGKKQPARLADGEFVVPARIVSELGNGSTEAGARKLYAMMDRIQKARGKTVGKGKVAKNSRSEKHLPA